MRRNTASIIISYNRFLFDFESLNAFVRKEAMHSINVSHIISQRVNPGMTVRHRWRYASDRWIV